MADEEEGPSLKGILVTAVSIVIVAVLITFLALSGGGGTEYSVTCDEYDGELGTGEKLREEWVISDNITSYKDIPEGQKGNLSNDTINILKGLTHSYNATNYTELSDKQKEVFREAIDERFAVVDNREKTPYVRVVYQDVVYFCDTDRMPD